jgi:hypothetical protein
MGDQRTLALVKKLISELESTGCKFTESSRQVGRSGINKGDINPILRALGGAELAVDQRTPDDPYSGSSLWLLGFYASLVLAERIEVLEEQVERRALGGVI